jgi:hypothetical protein
MEAETELTDDITLALDAMNLKGKLAKKSRRENIPFHRATIAWRRLAECFQMVQSIRKISHISF